MCSCCSCQERCGGRRLRVWFYRPEQSSRVPETTYSGHAVYVVHHRRAARLVGPEGAIPTYVTLPSSKASDASIPAAFASSISSLE